MLRKNNKNRKNSRAPRAAISKSKLSSLFIFNNPLGRVLLDIATNKTLLKKISFTFFIIIIYRGLSVIPLPGTDMAVYREYFGSTNPTEANYLFSVFTGGQLETPSIVGLGIAAYINASIIMQLLSPVIPKLSELQKEGAQGQQAITQYTRYLTVVLSLVYSFAYLLLISKRDLNSADGVTASSNPVYLIPRPDGADWPTMTKIIFMTLILAAGSILIMWLSEIVTDKGIGNGSSIIISIGVLSSIPTLVKNDFQSVNFNDIFGRVFEGNFGILTSAVVMSLVGVILGLIIMNVAIVFINESSRKVKIQYARRVRGTEAGEGSNLPIKLTLTGVMPMIFASALLSFPQVLIPVLSNFFKDSNTATQILDALQNSFLLSSIDSVVDGKDVVYIVFNFILIIAFAVFYAFIIMKPSDTAENLQKSGAFIPGIRPGKSTENYIGDVILRISFAGGIFLALIALVPLISRNLLVKYADINLFLLSGIAGTSILIVVSVILDTVRQYESLKATKSYEKYS